MSVAAIRRQRRLRIAPLNPREGRDLHRPSATPQEAPALGSTRQGLRVPLDTVAAEVVAGRIQLP